jgi:hypothetical protein
MPREGFFRAVPANVTVLQATDRKSEPSVFEDCLTSGFLSGGL